VSNKLIIRLISAILCAIVLMSMTVVESGSNIEDWGFYGHRKINKMAVFTLPQELFAFYKPHVQYISEHAVDPDKRRYALKNEAYRHYIDVDHWDTLPFNNLSKDIKTASLTHSRIFCLTKSDTTLLEIDSISMDLLYDAYIYEDRYSTQVALTIEDLGVYIEEAKLSSCRSIYFDNAFVKYGVLPYFLEDFYGRLVLAFMAKDLDFILKISADIGHYIGDAHVPLHTTKNYNGQLTGQLGLHAFWESRIPELFADEEYDFLVGRADYIEDKKPYFWDIIAESHRLLPEVLAKEKELRKTIPEDQQLCFEDRLERTVWTQCPEFAKAYETALGGTIELRMQAAVLSVGDVWYSAWVDAGQPDLSILGSEMDDQQLKSEIEELDKAVQNGTIIGRSHN